MSVRKLLARMAGMGVALTLTGFLIAPSAMAGSTSVAGHVIGGGAGQLSQFGFSAVVEANGAATGHFNCLMAGRTVGNGVGTNLMSIAGPITSGSLGSGQAAFSGEATVGLGSGGIMATGAPYTVTVFPGGPGVGHFTLSVPSLGITLSDVLVAGNIEIS